MAVELRPLADRGVVITGASSGIGLATARKAAKAAALGRRRRGIFIRG